MIVVKSALLNVVGPILFYDNQCNQEKPYQLGYAPLSIFPRSFINELSLIFIVGNTSLKTGNPKL